MMVLVNEINKVSLYCQNKGYTEVTPDIVELCCPPDLSGKIFDIMDACGSGNAQKALGTLDKLIANKEPLVKIRASKDPIVYMNLLPHDQLTDKT